MSEFDGVKKKQGAGSARAASAGSLRDEVDRLIAKGWFKDAIKQAKICQRDHPSPEHHRLLERTHLLRAQELHAGGMATAAREVVGHLLNLGVTDPDLNEPLAALLLAVGMAGEALQFQSRLDSPGAVERITRQAADQAVLHPDRVVAISPAIIAGANQVRAALEAVTAGNEAAALDGLRDVARSSPFADWRLFARGLAASRRGDQAESRANWDRLDPDRAAARIARALGSVADDIAPAKGSSEAAQRDGLERWAFGESVFGPLRDLATTIAEGSWDEVVRRAGALRLALRRVDPALAVRLTQALIDPLTSPCGEAELSRRPELDHPVHEGGRAAADRPPLEPVLGPGLGRAAGAHRGRRAVLAQIPRRPRRDRRDPGPRIAT